MYDATSRLVKVQASVDGGAATFQTAEFDGLRRRIKQVVTNSGDRDGTVVYLYDGNSDMIVGHSPIYATRTAGIQQC